MKIFLLIDNQWRAKAAGGLAKAAQSGVILANGM